MNRKWIFEENFPEYQYALEEIINPQIKSPAKVLEDIFSG